MGSGETAEGILTTCWAASRPQLSRRPGVCLDLVPFSRCARFSGAEAGYLGHQPCQSRHWHPGLVSLGSHWRFCSAVSPPLVPAPQDWISVRALLALHPCIFRHFPQSVHVFMQVLGRARDSVSTAGSPQRQVPRDLSILEARVSAGPGPAPAAQQHWGTGAFYLSEDGQPPRA